MKPNVLKVSFVLGEGLLLYNYVKSLSERFRQTRSHSTAISTCDWVKEEGFKLHHFMAILARMTGNNNDKSKELKVLEKVSLDEHLNPSFYTSSLLVTQVIRVLESKSIASLSVLSGLTRNLRVVFEPEVIERILSLSFRFGYDLMQITNILFSFATTESALAQDRVSVLMRCAVRLQLDAAVLRLLELSKKQGIRQPLSELLSGLVDTQGFDHSRFHQIFQDCENNVETADWINALTRQNLLEEADWVFDQHLKHAKVLDSKIVVAYMQRFIPEGRLSEIGWLTKLAAQSDLDVEFESAKAQIFASANSQKTISLLNHACKLFKSLSSITSPVICEWMKEFIESKDFNSCFSLYSAWKNAVKKPSLEMFELTLEALEAQIQSSLQQSIPVDLKTSNTLVHVHPGSRSYSSQIPKFQNILNTKPPFRKKKEFMQKELISNWFHEYPKKIECTSLRIDKMMGDSHSFYRTLEKIKESGECCHETAKILLEWSFDKQLQTHPSEVWLICKTANPAVWTETEQETIRELLTKTGNFVLEQ